MDFYIWQSKLDYLWTVSYTHLDPMIVPRAVVVVESMAAVTILDGVLKNLGATMDNIKKIYGE